MRNSIGVIAVVLLLGLADEARSAGWPSWRGFSGHGGCASGACGSAFDDSPLQAQLTYFTFQRSNCRLPACSGLDLYRDAPTGVPVSFPPLPYSHRASGTNVPGTHAFP